MRIVFVTTEYVSEAYCSGGLGNYVRRVSLALTSMGHEVDVLVPSSLASRENEEYMDEGIRIHPIERSWSLVGRMVNMATLGLLVELITNLKFSFKVHQILLKLHKMSGIDMAQFCNLSGCGLISNLLPLPFPSCVRVSNYRPSWDKAMQVRASWNRKANQVMELLQVMLARHVFSPSVNTKKIWQKRIGVNRVQVIRSPFFLENSEWDYSVFDRHLSEKEYLLFFGRLELHKGIQPLAGALPDFLATNEHAFAVFVGLDRPTPVAVSMRDYIVSCCGDLADRLVFIGQTPHSRLYPIISNARLVVLPSLVDNFPNACLEAMALGKPVIGTIGASFEEIIIDGETGFLVPAGSMDALAAKLNEAWVHPRLDEIGRAASKRMEEFVPDRTVQDLLDYYALIQEEYVHRKQVDRPRLFKSGRQASNR